MPESGLAIRQHPCHIGCNVDVRIADARTEQRDILPPPNGRAELPLYST